MNDGPHKSLDVTVTAHCVDLRHWPEEGYILQDPFTRQGVWSTHVTHKGTSVDLGGRALLFFHVEKEALRFDEAFKSKHGYDTTVFKCARNDALEVAVNSDCDLILWVKAPSDYEVERIIPKEDNNGN